MFNSCKKDGAIQEEDLILNSNIELNDNDNLELFLSNEKTNDLLKSTAFKWEQSDITISNRENSDKVKDVIVEINSKLNHKYVDYIIEENGLPLWDANIHLDLEEGGSLSAAPIFKVGDNEINSIILYTKNSNGNESYDLVTRREMEANLIQVKDRDFGSRTRMFKHFDSNLFGKDISVYDEWDALVYDDDLGESLDCYLIQRAPLSVPGAPSLPALTVSTCASGCFTELYESSILGGIAEKIWLNGNCNFGIAINDFLKNNNSNQMLENQTARMFFDIALSGVLTYDKFEGLLNEFDAFLQNSDENAATEALVQYFYDNNLNPTTGDVFGLATVDPYLSIPDDAAGTWIPMTGPDFFAQTNSIRAFYKLGYPSQTTKIDNFWACRVLGISQEKAVLASLGEVPNNIKPAAYTHIFPDGFEIRLFLDLGLYPQPNFIEVKGRYVAGATFNWAPTTGQFFNYRDYLKDPVHTFQPTKTIQHGIYLILPAGVTLNPNIAAACTTDNIPLYLSTIERNTANTSKTEIRVSRPQCVNFSGLNRDLHLTYFFNDTYAKRCSEDNMYFQFDYDPVIVDFDGYASIFETEYLVGNEPVLGCNAD